jgi:hypothetical protein
MERPAPRRQGQAAVSLRGHPATPGHPETTPEPFGTLRVGVISGKLGGVVRSTPGFLGAGEVVPEPGVRVLGAVNCRCERDLQTL